MNDKIEDEGADATGWSASNPVYRTAPANFKSEWVYFYYLKAHSDPNPVRVYRIERNAPIYRDEIASKIGGIFGEVKSNSHRVDGRRIREVPWLHRAYLVFVLEHQGRVIEDITFRFYQTGGNHSFRGGGKLSSILGHQNATAFFCVNRMRSQHGRDLEEGEAEVFKVKVNHPDFSIEDNLPFFGHEDSGTNLGPPIGGG